MYICECARSFRRYILCLGSGGGGSASLPKLTALHLVQICQCLTTKPIRTKLLLPHAETGFTGSGEIIHHRSKRVTSLPDAPLLRIGERFPKAAHLAPEQGEAQKPPCEVRSRWSTRRLVPHHPQPPLRLPPSSTTRADAPRPPRLPPRALPDFHSVPSSPLRFSRISQGRQYLLAPIPAGAPSLLHRDNRTLCPALATTTRPYGPPYSVPTRGAKT